MNIYKFIVYLIFVLTISGCVSVIVDPKVGMTFESNIWTANGAYAYAGESSEGTIYRNNRTYSSFYNGGIVVYGGRVVKVVQPSDLNWYITDQQRQKAQLQRGIQREAQQKRQALIDAQPQQQIQTKAQPQNSPAPAIPQVISPSPVQSAEKNA